MDPIFILIVILILVALGTLIALLRAPSGSRAPAATTARPAATQPSTPRGAVSPAQEPTPAAASQATSPMPVSTAGAPAVPEAATSAPGAAGMSPAAATAALAATDEAPQATAAPPETPEPTTATESPAAQPIPAEKPEQSAFVPPSTPDSALDVSRTAASDGAGQGLVSPLEAVSRPATRSGEIHLQVSPQRLPYRFAELVGEQRQLEEAITLLHRRIDDVEFDADPGSYENRVRLGVLRQELAQKQERLREILFLQDGYRWLQQHMALDRAPDEAPAG
jgi:hypothetical protein